MAKRLKNKTSGEGPKKLVLIKEKLQVTWLVSKYLHVKQKFDNEGLFDLEEKGITRSNSCKLVLSWS